MRPKFIYFDLGKVLADFSVAQMCRQMGAVAGIDADRVHEILYGGGLQLDYETGKLSSREFYEAFCQAAQRRPDYQALHQALGDIFSISAAMLPIVAQLSESGWRLGILSNTCETHWKHCLRQYAILRECFSVYALSYEIGALKPSAVIYRRAAELAGCRPEEIFFTDDVAGHVAGARAAGLDAVLFTSPAQVAADLRVRDVWLNY